MLHSIGDRVNSRSRSFLTKIISFNDLKSWSKIQMGYYNQNQLGKTR
jgi:hypothetical protein